MSDARSSPASDIKPVAASVGVSGETTEALVPLPVTSEDVVKLTEDSRDHAGTRAVWTLASTGGAVVEDVETLVEVGNEEEGMDNSSVSRSANVLLRYGVSEGWSERAAVVKPRLTAQSRGDLSTNSDSRRSSVNGQA